MKRFLNSYRSPIYCLGELIVGILILIDPHSFTSGIIRLAGVVFSIMGVLSLMSYFRSSAQLGSMSMGFSKGLILIAGGLFCVFNPGWFIKAFPLIAVVYGVGLIRMGLIKLQWSVDSMRLGSGLWMVPGIGALSSLVLGVIIVLNPFAAEQVMWIFVGSSLIFEAVVDAVSTFTSGRRFKKGSCDDSDDAEVEFSDI